MRAVLATNVVISATLIWHGNEDRILRAWQRGAFDLVLSPAILEEMARALSYERLSRARWMTAEEALALLVALGDESVLVPGRLRIRASRDPEDDKFLGAAIEAQAEYVVSGDRDLLDLGSFRGVQICRPAAFLKILRDRERRRS
jgi:putative PIN family toxin of toxin-antitoxin system